MSLETYIQAMPKVELGLQLEGAIPQQTLLMLADQNEVAASIKGYDRYLAMLRNPDADNIDQLVETFTQWIVHPDDLSRVIYDVGVSLSKQNIKYAEIGLNPSLFMRHGMTFDSFMEAIEDGCDRVRRGWKVELKWSLNISRSEPRRSDEIARWVASAKARKFGVIALGLVGDETAQPPGQFERAFRNADKKSIATLVHAGDAHGATGVLETLDVLHPDRLAGAWGISESQDALKRLSDDRVPLDLSISEARFNGQIENLGDYPLRQLVDDNLNISLSARMPELFGVSLGDSYHCAVTECGLTVDELEQISLNAVRNSFLDDEELQSLLTEFEQAYAALRLEHLDTETTE